MAEFDPRELVWGRRVANDPEPSRDPHPRARRRTVAERSRTWRPMPAAVDTLPVVGLNKTLSDRHDQVVTGIERALEGCGHELEAGRCRVCRWPADRCGHLACFPKTVDRAPVRLWRERSNEHDWNAVSVSVDGGQVGYLGAQWAARLAPELDAGAVWEAGIARVRRRPGSGFPGVDVWLRRRAEAPGRVEPREMYESSPPEGCVCVLVTLPGGRVPQWSTAGCPVHTDDPVPAGRLSHERRTSK